MKKILALVITFIYVFSTNAAFAMSKLYYLNNANSGILSSEVETILEKQNYILKKKSPFWALHASDPNNYVVVLLEPSGQNLFFYMESNKKISQLEKAAKKLFKQQNISYQEYTSERYLNYFSQIAQNTMINRQKVYSFDNSQNQSYQPTSVTKTQPSNDSLRGYVASVGAGSVLDIYLQTSINTATAQVGDCVIGVLKNDWVADGQHVVAPQGSILHGYLTKASPATYGSQNGRVSINFNKLETPSGKIYDLSTQAVDFEITNDGKFQRTTSNVLAAAAMGALAGLVIALISGGNCGTSAAIGAGAAGGTVLVSAVAEKGVDAEIPSYTELDVKIEKNINVIFNY